MTSPAVDHIVNALRDACLRDDGLTPPGWTPADEQAAKDLAAEIVEYRQRTQARSNVVTFHLPMEFDRFTRILQAVAAEFPDANIVESTPNTVTIGVPQ